jgi:hypothetical protein
MKKYKLFSETMFDIYDYDVIIEQQNQNKPLEIKIKGPYVVSEVKNANGRTYRKSLLETKSIPEFQKNWIDQRRAYCELNHPQSSSIDPRLASDRILSLKQEDNIWIGESVVLCSDSRFGIKGTPNGDIVASLLQHGGKIGKSTRGVGTVNESNIVEEDYKLITVDTVVDPSGPGCFVDGILESKEFMINEHGDIIEIAYNKFEKNINNLPNTHQSSVKNEYIYGLFENFINNINK